MYTAPSVEEIIQDLRNSVQSEVAGTDPWIWPNNLVPVLKAFGQALRMGYLRLEFIHQQAFATTATGDYLDWHGLQAGGLSRNPPGFAQGSISSPSVLGVVVYDGTAFMRSDGETFITVGTVTATTGTLTLFVRAYSAGELANTDAGATLTPMTPIAGVGAFTVATGGLIGGRAAESDDSFRQRILYRKQNPPHGGTPAEYVEWCQTKSGVTRVFVKRATPQPGSVTIYFMMDSVGNGLPAANDIEQMKVILQTLAPSDANVIVGKPVPSVVNVTVQALVPDTAAVRDDIVAELKAMFMRRAEPASTIEPSHFSLAWINEAVAMAPKWVRSHNYFTDQPSSPNIVIPITSPGGMPTLGTVRFIA